MKRMNSTLHGIIDCATVLFWSTGPSLLKLSSPNIAFMKAFSGAFLGINLATRYPLAVKKSIPFPIHGTVEVGSVLMFLGLSLNPMIEKKARLFYLASSVQLASLVLLSNYDDKSTLAQPPAFEDSDEMAAVIPPLKVQHDQVIREEQEAIQGVKLAQAAERAES